MADPLSRVADHLASITQFLSQPLITSLFQTHPNDLGRSSFQPPAEWEEWWNWAGDTDEDGTRDDPLLLLSEYYNSRLSEHQSSSNTVPSIPPHLRSLIDDACRLALSRDIGRVYPASSIALQPSSELKAHALPGMSPKKAHEVLQMAGFLETLLSSRSTLGTIRHVVDIGAGQVRRSRCIREGFMWTIGT